jgi:death-on-curing protein
MAQTGGALGIHDLGALESALAQPRMTFGAVELYPSLTEKASALAFSMIQNHPFLDGNKRTGHAVLEVFLLFNGHTIAASIDEQERVVLLTAAGEFTRDQLTEWLQAHIVEVAPTTGESIED